MSPDLTGHRLPLEVGNAAVIVHIWRLSVKSAVTGRGMRLSVRISLVFEYESGGCITAPTSLCVCDSLQ